MSRLHRSIPLALVVDSFSVFHSGQGNQGKLGRLSKQQLAAVFESEKEEDAVKIILERGLLQTGSGLQHDPAHKNDARGSGFVESRGAIRN
ncbi:hypothetical protein FRC03_005289 [Tulasnella sp. 419]|nr:hypothetical protein FRC03_005289 [Tulasnella sp. 419]